MPSGAPRSFGAQLRALRETAGYTQEELATIAGLSVHAVSALERGERRRPHLETVRALCAALDLTGPVRDAFVGSARARADIAAVEELGGAALPLAPTTLLGRDADVQALRQWSADPAVRLITLTGPGGVGKTRLALEVAHAMAAGRTSRVVFVPLAPIRTAAFVGPAIADALGLSNVAAPDLPNRARTACADRPTLLVLDNFEHVIAAAPLVAELLTSVASLSVLITSRALLHVRGEREYALGPLASGGRSEEISPADLARTPAVRLFVERVRDVQPDFRLTSANGPAVAAICRRLDGLPLALELAAPWMKVLTVDDLLSRLEHDVLFSPVGRRDLPERQQTMNATVAWSYQLLGARERRAFRRLGALPGRFPLEAAAAVLAGREGPPTSSDDALGAIAVLIDKSLLLRAEASEVSRPQFQMLEVVRAFAELELTASDERDDALEGLARYCAREAALAVEGLMGPAQTDWLDRVRDDLESYRAALAWLIERGRSSEASDIAWGLLWFWAIRGHAVEGLRWYEQILDSPPLAPGAETRALLGAAGMRYIHGDFEGARADLTSVRALAAHGGDIGSAVHAEFVLGHVDYATGRLDAAREHFARSVDGFTAAAHTWGTGQALSGLAWVSLAKGEGGEAERLLEAAASRLRDAGPWSLLLGLYIRATLWVQRGNPDAAIAVARESLTHIRNLKDTWNFLYTLVPLAAAAALRGDDAWVARILGARDAVTESTGARVVDAAVHGLHQAVERDARARLGPERWAVAYAAGRKTSIDALLKDIDGVLRAPASGAS